MDPSGEADATRPGAEPHGQRGPGAHRAARAGRARPAHRLEDANCRTCCACRTASPGATACIRSWTTASARPPAARQDAAQCPRLVAAHGPVALCVLAGRAGAAVRPAGRSRRVPGPGDQRRVRRGARGLAPPSVGMDAARPHPHHDERRGGGRAPTRTSARASISGSGRRRAVAARQIEAGRRAGPPRRGIRPGRMRLGLRLGFRRVRAAGSCPRWCAAGPRGTPRSAAPCSR